MVYVKLLYKKVYTKKSYNCNIVIMMVLSTHLALLALYISESFWFCSS